MARSRCGARWRTCPPPSKPLLAWALQREPAARHATAGELRDALRAGLATVAPAYGRTGAAEELALLLAAATVIRDRVEFSESGLGPEGLDSHEL